MPKYIYQYEHWTAFTWDDAQLHSVFGEVRNLQGRIAGQMEAVGFSSKEEARLKALTLDVVKSSEIEGENLDYNQVRSSIARRLGVNTAGLVESDKNVEGVVEMMLDASENYLQPLTNQRLFGWHAALFPTGFSGMHSIEVARYRTGEMQIVSGALGKEKAHFEAVKAENVEKEMQQLLDWVNTDQSIDAVLKAAMAHFWFIIIHPFDDGNGRIARAITDMLLSRSEKSPERFYSMSSQIMHQKKDYYAVLQRVQHSSGDITEWLLWFLKCLKSALMDTEQTLENVLQKPRFWKQHEETFLNARQRLMLHKLFEGFEGKLNNAKWAKIAKCSSDTALRDINDLISKDILRRENQGGRSTNYVLVDF